MNFYTGSRSSNDCFRLGSRNLRLYTLLRMARGKCEPMWVQSARTSNGAAKQRISAPCFDNLANGSCLELLPVAAWFCDKEGKVRQANRRAIRLWGRTPKDDISSERFCGSHKLLYADDTPMARE